MLDLAWAVVGFIVALSILVCFHEFGHYWVARRCGVKVLRFCLGWGKPWKSFRAKDGVEWAIAPYPIGGYVKMLDEREAPVPPEQRHLAFNNQSIPKRMAILVAGPAANFLLAIVIYWLILMIGMPGFKPLIAEPRAGTAAEQVGLGEQDQILAVGGREISTWSELRLSLIDDTLGADTLDLSIRQASGALREVSLPLSSVRSDPEFLFGDLGLDLYQPRVDAVIGEVTQGESADAAGLLKGDRVLSIDGEAIDQWHDLVRAVQARPGKIARFQIDRDGREIAVDVVIGTIEREGAVLGRLGAGTIVDRQMWQNLRALRQLGPIEALPTAVGQTWQMTQLTLRVLWHMVLGEVSVKNVSGPIQIAQVAGDTARIGLVHFLSFMAVVSVSLGVLNLLPIPLLDGGHLMMYAVEAVKGRPLSERAQVAAQYVGLAFIGALMLLALFNDIMRLV